MILCALLVLAHQDTTLVAARDILAQQTKDGAITMSKIGEAESTVNPYSGCIAADGLLAAYAHTKDSAYLDGAIQWADWYASHQNPDGTIYDYKGHNGAWASTKQFDSSDSYAAVNLEFVWRLWHSDPGEQWVRVHALSVGRAIEGVELTLQPSGLTIAKPTYPVMFTMDNVESLKGLRAAVSLESVLGDRFRADHVKSEADKMAAAIQSQEWDESREAYRAAVQVDGGKQEGLSAWYPDVITNLMAVAWLPTSQRNADLYSRLYAKFGDGIPASIKDQNELARLVWWGWAAKGAGDQQLLDEIRARLAGFDATCAGGCDPGLLGHVAMLCQ